MEDKEIRYKGKGEHSVNELELIIYQREEELHRFKSEPTIPLSEAFEFIEDVLVKGWVFDKVSKTWTHNISIIHTL